MTVSELGVLLNVSQAQIARHIDLRNRHINSNPTDYELASWASVMRKAELHFRGIEKLLLGKELPNA